MTSSITTTTLTQDEIKAELKELMQLPENMICSDCDDKRPTWASLIVPPPNTPFKDPIGCFCCFQCSGAHRMLGTHISFVRSTNLDEWKEKELIAMRQGGNKLVNALFEGKLTDGQRKVVRPDNRTDLETRKNYIFEKYKDRKWFSQESYDVYRPRDRLDAALSSIRMQKKEEQEEDDFFSQRAMNAAPNNSNSSFHMSIDECSAASNKNNNDSDWWKVSGNSSFSSSSTPASKKHGSVSSKEPELSSWKSPIPFDRRNLMSSVQKESQRKLMAEFNHIDTKNGSLRPSSLRLKAKRSPTRNGSGQRHASSSSLILSDETAPLKEESPSRPRSQLLRLGGVSRNNSNSSAHSADSSKRPPRRPGVSRTFSNSSSHCSEGSDRRRDKRGVSRTHSSSSSCHSTTDDRTKSRSSRSKLRGVARTSSSGSGSYSSTDDGSMQPRKPIRSTKDPIPRAKSFDQMLSFEPNPSPNSAKKQNRIRKTHSDRAPQTPVRSPKGNESFIDDIHASLAQINMNIAGDDEVISPRQPQRRRPDRATTASAGGDDESQTSSRRMLQALRDDESQARSSRRSTRPSSKLDDSSSQLNVGDRRVRSSSRARSPRSRSVTRKARNSKSPRQREGSRSRQLPPSRTPSPDLWRNAIPPSPGGGGGAHAPGSRVPKDRKPRVPSRPISSSSIPSSTSPQRGPGSSSRQVIDSKLETKLSTEMINVKW